MFGLPFVFTKWQIYAIAPLSTSTRFYHHYGPEVVFNEMFLFEVATAALRRFLSTELSCAAQSSDRVGVVLHQDLLSYVPWYAAATSDSAYNWLALSKAGHSNLT